MGSGWRQTLEPHHHPHSVTLSGRVPKSGCTVDIGGDSDVTARTLSTGDTVTIGRVEFEVAQS